MTRRNSPGGLTAVLPGEILGIPRDGGKLWLTLFYCLPKELAGKRKPSLDLPRCPYEVLRMNEYDGVAWDDMFKLLIWDCCSWSVWQFFKVKDRRGGYREIPGSGARYAGCFSLRRFSYSTSLCVYMRMEFEKIGLSFQELYDVPPGVEAPWLPYRQSGNLIGSVTDPVTERQNWQPVIDDICENRGAEDCDARSSAVKSGFMRKWHHDRSGRP